jgi:prepilin-type processing-associated H-X9-DG protein
MPVTWGGVPGYAHWSPWGGWMFGLSEPGQNPGLDVVLKVFTCPTETEPRVVEIITSAGTQLKQAQTDYLGVNGTNYKTIDGTLASNRYVRLTDITDGTSNTVAVGERGGSPSLTYGVWFAGCGQLDTTLPPGDDQRGSADVALGVRELNSQQNGFLETDRCPPGPYHFQPPGQIKDATGNVNRDCDIFHFWSRHAGGANFLLADGSVRFLAYSADSVLDALGTTSAGEVVDLP